MDENMTALRNRNNTQNNTLYIDAFSLYRSGGVAVRTLDLGSRGHRFDFRSRRYQVIIITWMGDVSADK